MEKQHTAAHLLESHSLPESTLTRNDTRITFPAYSVHLTKPPYEGDDWNSFVFTIGGMRFQYHTGLAHRHIQPDFEGDPECEKEYSIAMRKSDISAILRLSHANLPTIEEFMHCIVSDSYASECDFDEWMCEFGYEDKGEAKRIYNACLSNFKRMVKAWPDFNLETLREYFQDY